MPFPNRQRTVSSANAWVARRRGALCGDRHWPVGGGNDPYAAGHLGVLSHDRRWLLFIPQVVCRGGKEDAATNDPEEHPPDSAAELLVHGMPPLSVCLETQRKCRWFGWMAGVTFP